MPHKKREPAEATLSYLLTFSFRHRVVSLAIEDEIRNDRRDAQILTNNPEWEMTESGDYMEQWIRFRSDEPFKPEEVALVLARIELLDAACEAMINGTAAEVRESAFKTDKSRYK